MTSDGRAETLPQSPPVALSPSSLFPAASRDGIIAGILADDGSGTCRGDPADPASRPALLATTHRRPSPTAGLGNSASTAPIQVRCSLLGRQPPQLQAPMDQRGAASPSHGCARSVTNSQESAATSSTDQIVTPPPSDTSAGLDGSATAEGCGGDGVAKEPAASQGIRNGAFLDAAGQDSQLHRLSAVAAAQHRMQPDEALAAGSRKRMADGLVKAHDGSVSPVKGHSRNTSAFSVASTTGSNIGHLSTELKTLLSYAMVKVHHGWQSQSLDEVESLASHATSPTSSACTMHPAHDDLPSPRQPALSGAPHVRFPQEPTTAQRSNSTPSLKSPGQSSLAAAALIQPSVPPQRSSLSARRNSNPRLTPSMLSRAPSASPLTPAAAPRPDARQPSMSRAEQDVAESLLFMSSPGNSANLKQTFSPSISPGAPAMPPRNPGPRHALPSGPRKALPSHRPVTASKKPGVMPPPPGSPMDLDSPQSSLVSPVRGTPRGRVNCASSHVRASLSLPSGLGMVFGNARKSLGNEDIERMIDRAGAESPDTSGSEEIQLPPGRRRPSSLVKK